MEWVGVGILIFPEVEVLDFCGPFEVFSVTRLDEAHRREEPLPFTVRLVAETPEPVTASGGLRVLLDCTFDVVARRYGEAVARATARHMEYPYPESLARRV